MFEGPFSCDAGHIYILDKQDTYRCCVQQSNFEQGRVRATNNIDMWRQKVHQSSCSSSLITTYDQNYDVLDLKRP